MPSNKQDMDDRAADNASLPPLAEVIQCYLEQYFSIHAGSLPEGRLHEQVMAQAEKPLLALVLQLTEQNQSKAADMLGINRNTLHKKMVAYGMIRPTAASKAQLQRALRQRSRQRAASRRHAA